MVPECVYDVCHFQLDIGAGAEQCGAGCCGNDNCSKFVVSPVLQTASKTVCPGKLPCGVGHDCCWLKGGASKFISGPYTTGSVYTSGRSIPCPPGQISISGPKFIERPLGEKERRHGVYQAQVLDLDGQAISGPEDITWSVSGGGMAAGVSISRGDLTVNRSLSADTITIVNVTASTGDLTATIEVTVAALKASGISITGPAAVDLGGSLSLTHAYTAVVVDQLGRAIDLNGSSRINWTLASAEQIDPKILPKMTKPPPDGVAINSETGLLTVVKSADRGDFTVQASLIGGADHGVHGAVFVAGDAFDAAVFLSTDDTAITLTVGGAGAIPGGPLRLRSLRHRTAGWEWICDDGVAVPLPSPRGPSPVNWAFVNATQNSTAATIWFTAAGDLELESIWIARSGGGPIENMVQIRNGGFTAVVFDSSLESASMKLMPPPGAVFSMFEKRGVGVPLPPMDLILRPEDKLSFSVPTGGPGHGTELEGQYIPLAFIKAEGSHYSGTAHGIYVGSEWELGHFNVTTRGSGSHLVDTFLVIAPIDPANTTKHLPADSVAIATGNDDPDIRGEFTVPTVYYGAFVGRQEDGSNSFKLWFWRHKITRSLHENANEPWVQQCWEPIAGEPFPGLASSRASQSSYNATAATGVEALKIDVGWYDARNWTYRAEDWPDGFDYKKKAHLAGMNTSLYMGGSYQDVNLSTVAGRDAELKAVLERYDAGYMDMWRTDKYTAPENPLPDSFAGVTNFLGLMDTLMASRPGFRYEDCGNGGHFKGLALARRFTFITTNDNAPNVTMYRQTHWVNTHVHNPLQLKCDTAFWNPQVRRHLHHWFSNSHASHLIEFPLFDLTMKC